ncbi:MAG: hypothetical protein CL434_12935 [Acidimicrobiaceae bacterium]|nr:hypothetical protein [Acidimicrobiaceae bacterium]
MPERIPIHQRSYETEAFDEGDGRMRVRGRLTDNKPQGLCLADGNDLVIHDMCIDLLVDPQTFTIVAVENEMMVRAYSNCEAILPNYQALVGVSITRGYSSRVKKLFGGPNGCSHMSALLQAMGPVAVQATWSFLSLHESLESRLNRSDDPEERERKLRMMVNSCHVWQEEGEHVEIIRKGNWMRTDWESQRLQTLGVDIPDQ